MGSFCMREVMRDRGRGVESRDMDVSATVALHMPLPGYVDLEDGGGPAQLAETRKTQPSESSCGGVRHSPLATVKAASTLGT